MTRLIPIRALFFTAAGCDRINDPGTVIGPSTTTAPYSQSDPVVGTGPVATNGTLLTVAYTGWLHDSAKPDEKGNQFDTSNNFVFRLGTVIRGWDQVQ